MDDGLMIAFCGVAAARWRSRTVRGSRPLPRHPQAVRLGPGRPRRRVAANGAFERRTRR